MKHLDKQPMQLWSPFWQCFKISLTFMAHLDSLWPPLWASPLPCTHTGEKNSGIELAVVQDRQGQGIFFISNIICYLISFSLFWLRVDHNMFLHWIWIFLKSDKWSHRKAYPSMSSNSPACFSINLLVLRLLFQTQAVSKCLLWS